MPTTHIASNPPTLQLVTDSTQPRRGAMETNALETKPSDLLDEARLATKLGVSRKTLQSWRYAGQGPRFIKIGRLVRYRVADIDAYLRAQTRGTAMQVV